MCKEVRALLEGLAGKKTSNFVFPHRDGGPCRMDVLALLKKAQKRAGIGGRLRIHDLRHTLGRRLRKDLGVPLETIMGNLRHADIRETLIYAPSSLHEGRAAMGKLDGGGDGIAIGLALRRHDMIAPVRRSSFASGRSSGPYPEAVESDISGPPPR